MAGRDAGKGFIGSHQAVALRGVRADMMPARHQRVVMLFNRRRFDV
jgi:hypothetical protein